MSGNQPFTKLQLYSLILLRIAIGWHLLFEGVSKLVTPNWSSIYFLRESKWIMSDFAEWISSNDPVLNVVDQLNIWGLIVIGTFLILGLFSRISALFGFVLLLIYYLAVPPLIGLEYSVASNENNLIVNRTLIEALSLLFLALSHESQLIGLDVFVNQFMNKKKSNDGKKG